MNLEPILAEDKESRDGFAGNKNKEIRITSLYCIEQQHIAVTARRKHLQWPLRVCTIDTFTRNTLTSEEQQLQELL